MTLREHAPDAEPTDRPVSGDGPLYVGGVDRKEARRRTSRTHDPDELWTDAAMRRLESRARRLLRRVPLPIRVAAGLAGLVYLLLTASLSDWLELLFRGLLGALG